MTQVKICGITNEEDALCAAECGAEALGFIFYPASPRYITPAAAYQIINQLPANIVTVGVFVNEVIAEVHMISQLCRFDYIQLHGDETPEYCGNFRKEMLIKAVELRDDDDLLDAAQYDTAAILVDNRADGLFGGTGKKANWNLAAKLKNKKPLILAGGLNETNIITALEKVEPQALDISSGVETKPGKKDYQMLTRIMKIIRQTEKQIERNEKILIKRKY